MREIEAIVAAIEVDPTIQYRPDEDLGAQAKSVGWIVGVAAGIVLSLLWVLLGLVPNRLAAIVLRTTAAIGVYVAFANVTAPLGLNTVGRASATFLMTALLLILGSRSLFRRKTRKIEATA